MIITNLDHLRKLLNLETYFNSDNNYIIKKIFGSCSAPGFSNECSHCPVKSNNYTLYQMITLFHQSWENVYIKKIILEKNILKVTYNCHVINTDCIILSFKIPTYITQTQLTLF
uniref:Uncharacterized protein n=1 Tax=viral metagenome TaxID=1070528 RepID=A0A6M3LI56_9ZZZZ